MTTHHLPIHTKRVVTGPTLCSPVAWRAKRTHRPVIHFGNPNLTQKREISDTRISRVVFFPCFPHVFAQDEMPLMDLLLYAIESHRLRHCAFHEEEFLGTTVRPMRDVMAYCQAVLYKQWPDVVKCSDIQKGDDDPFGPIDVVVGGFPCQPFSFSGWRRGTEYDRHLWPFALAILERKQPTWVRLENVAGFISLALDLVQTDLEHTGYLSQAFVLPACAVGVPHIRERVFIVAHSTGKRCPTWGTQCAGQQGPLFADRRGASDPAHSSCSGCGQWTNQSKFQPECMRASNAGDDGMQGDLARTNCQRQQECHASTWSNSSGLVTRCTDSDVAHPDGQRGPFPAARRDAAKQVVEYTSPGPSQPRMGGGSHGLASRLDSHRWPPATNQTQEQWEPPRTIAHTLKHRASRLKALGNMAVPQQVSPILNAMTASERTWSEEVRE